MLLLFLQKPFVKKLLVAIFFLALICYPKLALADIKDGILNCSLVAILAEPGAFENRLVWTEGFLTTKGYTALWLSENDFKQQLRLNAVRLSFSDDTKFSNLRRTTMPALLECDGKYVFIQGRFSRKDMAPLESFMTGKVTVTNVGLK
jgi:hypothetical protein